MDVSSEYANQLKAYMKNFSLYNVDIAYLAKTNSEVIAGILQEKKGIVLKTLEAISNIFSLRYFEFGNPRYPIPTLESLPSKTQQRISFRKKEGLPKETIYSQNAINERIKTILLTYKIGSEFLAEEIANNILRKYGETYPVSEIVDRFKKTFKVSIEKTGRKDATRQGRGPKPVFYRFVKAL